MQSTTSIAITVSSHKGKPSARCVMWGIDAGGQFGSTWSRDIPLEGVDADSTPRELLFALAVSMAARVVE